MKEEELMIGDWVHSKIHNVDSKIITIEGKGYHSVWLESKECWERHYMNEIEPIQLTEELLEKCFPTDEELAWWPETRVNGKPYDFHFEYARVNLCVAVDLRHVHELQHILKLCGIEKELKV